MTKPWTGTCGHLRGGIATETCAKCAEAEVASLRAQLTAAERTVQIREGEVEGYRVRAEAAEQRLAERERERDEARFRADDWHKVADDRSAEIVRQMKKLTLADALAEAVGEYERELTRARLPDRGSGRTADVLRARAAMWRKAEAYRHPAPGTGEDAPAAKPETAPSDYAQRLAFAFDVFRAETYRIPLGEENKRGLSVFNARIDAVREIERLASAVTSAEDLGATPSAPARAPAAAPVAQEPTRCERCDHLDEVHGEPGCHGGPEADCTCRGFRAGESQGKAQERCPEMQNGGWRCGSKLPCPYHPPIPPKKSPEPCPRCGAEAKRATRVPGWTCPSCGCLFRRASPPAASAPPPRCGGCGYREDHEMHREAHPGFHVFIAAKPAAQGAAPEDWKALAERLNAQIHELELRVECPGALVGVGRCGKCLNCTRGLLQRFVDAWGVVPGGITRLSQELMSQLHRLYDSAFRALAASPGAPEGT